MTEDEFEQWVKTKISNPNFCLENYKEWDNKEAKTKVQEESKVSVAPQSQ